MLVDMKLKLKLRKTIVLAIIIVFNTVAYSMPVPVTGGPSAGGPPGGSPPVGSPPAGGPPCWNPPCVPIDGGIGILLAAGAFVGARKIYRATRG